MIYIIVGIEMENIFFKKQKKNGDEGSDVTFGFDDNGPFSANL
jgi:hypothetical protein